MPVSRLAHIPGIGVDEMGDAADATGNPDLLRREPRYGRAVTRGFSGRPRPESPPSPPVGAAGCGKAGEST